MDSRETTPYLIISSIVNVYRLVVDIKASLISPSHFISISTTSFKKQPRAGGKLYFIIYFHIHMPVFFKFPATVFSLLQTPAG